MKERESVRERERVAVKCTLSFDNASVSISRKGNNLLVGGERARGQSPVYEIVRQTTLGSTHDSAASNSAHDLAHQPATEHGNGIVQLTEDRSTAPDMTQCEPIVQ